MTAPYGSVVAQMIAALGGLGPMTNRELCEAIGLDKLKVGAVLSRLVRESIDTPRRAHICAYTHDAEGARSYPRAVYALGDRPNVPKPKSRPAVNSRRYRARKTTFVNSVFMLGMTQRQRSAHFSQAQA